jgi:hypothetical protein
MRGAAKRLFRKMDARFVSPFQKGSRIQPVVIIIVFVMIPRIFVEKPVRR